MRETRNAYTILVGKPEGNRPLGRPRRKWGRAIAQAVSRRLPTAAARV
jgi:hypothetical protein